MKARVSLTPAMMEKLINGKSLAFKIRPGVDSLEVRLLDTKDAFFQFDRVFDKVWKGILRKIERLAE